MSVHFLTPPLMLALVFFSVLLTVFSNGLLDIDSRGGLLQGAIMGNTIGNAVAMSGYMLLSGLEALVVPATLFMHAPDRKKAVAWSKKASADMRYIAIFALMVYATLPVPVFIKGVFYIVFVAVLYACFKRKCVEFGPLE